MQKRFGSEPNVQVHSDTEPEPPLRFMFNNLAEPKPRTLCLVRVRTLLQMFRTELWPVYIIDHGVNIALPPSTVTIIIYYLLMIPGGISPRNF